MKVIGLTGGIGSGKSTVSRLLAKLGAFILDADDIGHEALEPNTKIWRDVVSAFGRQVLTPNEKIDRKKLADIVFGDPESLSRLNQIMHPRMYDIAKIRLDEYRRQGTRVLVLEAPLLLEADWASLVDEIWVTTAPETTILKRLKERSGMPHAEALVRIRSQMPLKKRVSHADEVINTNVTLDQLGAKVEKLWQQLRA